MAIKYRKYPFKKYHNSPNYILKDYYKDYTFGLCSIITSALLGSFRVLSNSAGVPEGSASAARHSALETSSTIHLTAGTPGRTEGGTV